jgi:hypothetical protein
LSGNPVFKKSTFHCSVRPDLTHYSGVDNVFCVDKVEGYGLKFFDSDCEYIVY